MRKIPQARFVVVFENKVISYHDTLAQALRAKRDIRDNENHTVHYALPCGIRLNPSAAPRKLRPFKFRVT